ncbi:MAG: tryptophan-rich sensory protein [Clostridia bacterium]|nr:tryptophan-rich sensory protein [Clostridia bacterium]
MSSLNKDKITKIIWSSIFILLVAVLGSVFVNLGMDWFNSLQKPSQWIPNIVIPIVWTIIYTTFGIINFLWIKKSEIPKNVVVLMIVNGVLNVLWCLVFFTLKLTFIGNIVIILNLIAGIVLWLNIFKTEKLYAYILSIYPLWLSIATTLNLALWILN